MYDLDNLEQKITITNRIDRMDFSILARYFAIQFNLVNQPRVTAEIVLEASLKDLAGEILELPGKTLGCSLLIRFIMRVKNVILRCQQIEQALNTIWENDIAITQTLSFVYKEEATSYLNIIEVKFWAKINEEHMGNITDFLNSVLESLDVLSIES